MSMTRQKRGKTKSPVVHRVPLVGPPVITKFPGHEGPRPILSFVLKTLAGEDSGMTEMHLSIPRGWRTPDEGKFFKKVFADPLAPEIARNSMIAMMRYLADLWIDSGKSGEGESRLDNPSCRNILYTPPSEASQILLNIDPSNEEPIPGFDAFLIPVGLPISNLFYQLIGNDARWPEIHEDGTQSLKELVFGFTTENAHSGYRFLLHWFGMKVAMYWFAKLLNSPFSRQLARCDDCGGFFAYERAPKKEIRGGTHCANCKGRGSAKRMESTRIRRLNEMVRLAAEVSERYRPDSRQPRTKWIAEQVNRRTVKVGVKAGKQKKSHYPLITGRWVTEHLKQIEEEIERRKNAKG
jgi:hypothetical protein